MDGDPCRMSRGSKLRLPSKKVRSLPFSCYEYSPLSSCRGGVRVSIVTLTEFLTSNHSSLSQNPLEENHFLRTQQLIQFLVIIISKGADIGDRQSTVSISEAVGHFLLNVPSEKTMLLREVFMAYAAVVSQRCPPSGLRKSSPNFDFEAIWRICIGNTTTGNLLLACMLVNTIL